MRALASFHEAAHAPRMADVTIWHNPRCSKSRQTLELIRSKGIEPTIIEYLKTPPTTAQIDAALKALEGQPRDLLRQKEEAYRALGLADTTLGHRELVAAMAGNPVLIERPVVFFGTRAVIGRPPEAVLGLLDL